MQEYQNSNIGSHKLQMQNRGMVQVTGVKDVVSFDSGEILLETIGGMLQFKGNELHVKRLTLEKGEVDIEGRVDSLVYSDVGNRAKSAGSMLGRLFH